MKTICVMLLALVIAPGQQPHAISLSTTTEKNFQAVFMEMFSAVLQRTKCEDEVVALMKPYHICASPPVSFADLTACKIKKPKTGLARFERALKRTNSIMKVHQSASSLLDASMGLVQSQIRLFMIEHQADVGAYRLDWKAKQFIRLPDDAKQLSAKDSAVLAFSSFLDEAGENVRSSLERLRQKR